MAHWLRVQRDDVVSPKLAEIMLELLGENPTTAYERQPYHLQRFPPLDDADPCERLRALLLWRAGVVDFLSDAWDTLGESDYGIDECRRMADLLAPVGKSNSECPLCLEQLTKEQAAKHYDVCPVQASWRAMNADSSQLDS